MIRDFLYISLPKTAHAEEIHKIGMVSRFQRYISSKTSASKLSIENRMKKIYSLSLIRHQMTLWNKKHWRYNYIQAHYWCLHIQAPWFPSCKGTIIIINIWAYLNWFLLNNISNLLSVTLATSVLSSIVLVYFIYLYDWVFCAHCTNTYNQYY